MTTAQQAFFLIDTEGIVRGQWRGTVSEVFPTEQILEAARTRSARDRVGATGVTARRWTGKADEPLSSKEVFP